MVPFGAGGEPVGAFRDEEDRGVCGPEELDTNERYSRKALRTVHVLEYPLWRGRFARLRAIPKSRE